MGDFALELAQVYEAGSGVAGQMVKLTPCGLEFVAAPSLEEWGEVFQRAIELRDCSQWWIGDLYNFGEEHFGPEMSQFLDAYNYKTVLNCARVSREWLLELRRETLSFSHHEVVLALPVEKRKRMLDEAEARAWSRDDLRQAVKEPKEENEYDSCVFALSSLLARAAHRLKDNELLAFAQLMAEQAKGLERRINHGQP